MARCCTAQPRHLIDEPIDRANGRLGFASAKEFRVMYIPGGEVRQRARPEALVFDAHRTSRTWRQRRMLASVRLETRLLIGRNHEFIGRRHWPTVTLVHTPVHASWLNQVEIYFSIVQRNVVTPNDFTSLRELEDRLLAFQVRYERTAKPFQWAFTPSGSGQPVVQAQSQGDEPRRLTGEIRHRNCETQHLATFW